MAVDDRTPNLNLPLPHADNNLPMDVERLRTALMSIDSAIHSFVTAPQPAEVEESHVLASGQTEIDLAVITGTSGASVYVEGVRLLSSAWSTDPVIETRIILGSEYPAGHVVTVVRRQ